MADISATTPLVPQKVLDDITAAMSQASTGLTSVNRQQAVRVQVTPDANGRFVYVFPQAYATGVIPAVQMTVETPAGVNYRNDVSTEENSSTSTQTAGLVTRIPKTLVASVLGAVLPVLTPVTTPVWVSIFVRAP